MRNIPIDECRWGLARVWYIMSATIFLVVCVYSMLDAPRFSENRDKLGPWFCNSILPTMGLITGILAFGAVQKADANHKKYVEIRYYRLARNLSLFYLTLGLLTLLIFPVRYKVGSPITLADHLGQSGYLLGITQGIVSAIIGGVFFKEPEAQDADNAKPGAPDEPSG